MRNRKMGICVVGLGWGHKHAKSYSEMDDVALYVCDSDPSKVERASQDFNVLGGFSSIDQALRSDRIDAIDVALPHHLHYPVALKAAEAGKHCMVEKPIAVNLREADAVLDAANRAGTRLAVAENYQFLPDVIEACRLIGEALIGTVFMVRVQELWRIDPRPGSWWFRRETAGGGNLISLGTHLVRTLRLLAGSRAVQVFALFSDKVAPELCLEGEDTSLLSVKFENDVVGSIVTSWATPEPGPGACFIVYGTEGSLVSQKGQPLVVYSRRIQGTESTRGELRIDATAGAASVDGIDTECREFVEWIRTGKESPVNARQGRDDLEIVEAAYRCAATGEAVRLPL